jgi:hypothetical protein
MRNTRRSYERDGTEIPPMTVGSMRESGIRSIYIECMACGREDTMTADRLPDHMPVPDIAMEKKNLCCPACGACGEKLYVRPNWSEKRDAGAGQP